MDAPLFLDEDTSVVVRHGKPFLEARRSGLAFPLKAGEAMALELLGAMGDPARAAAEAGRALKGAEVWVGHVVERYWSFLGGHTARPAAFAWLDRPDRGRASTGRRTASRRQVAPKAVVWLVTLGCNRACPFCFYDVHPWDRGLPPDATFSRAAVSRMLVEMREVGASQLYLTGGEPFLRPDLVEIMEEAEGLRIRCDVATRFPLDPDTCRRLAALTPGLITFSLDAGDARRADGLAGRQGFFQEALRTIESLVAAGAALEVNAVITRPNEEHLDNLVSRLAELGVRRLSLSRYVPPVSRRSSPGLMPQRSEAETSDLIRLLAAEWSGRMTIREGDSGGTPSDAAGRPGNVCEVGFSEVHVLPDGTATRCRYLPGEARLRLGSLETATLMEVWTGEALASLNRPEPSAYAGTACGSCGLFGACNERGRCFVGALAVGTLAGPDNFCGRSQ